MILHLLYTPNTPADRDLEELQRRLAGLQITPELVNADSRSGIALAELYDVMQRPAVIATDDNGQLMQKWEGDLPRLEDIMPYLPTI